MDDSLVYLNGAYVPLSEASISVLDRGFIFGDGVYDVIPVYGRRLFQADAHLARLARSLAAIRLRVAEGPAQWLAIARHLVDRSPEPDRVVYFQVTRGAAPRRHGFPEAASPTVLVMTMPLQVPDAGLRERGVACVSAEDRRWLHCDIKSTSLLGNVLAAQYAAEHDAVETIQFRDGVLTEGSSSNVWVVKAGKLLAPLKDERVLEGIRYGLFEQLCADLGIPFELRDIAREEVLAADEVLLSSASKEVLPVVRIDDHPIGSGRPGPVGQRLYQAYQRAKRA